MVINFFRDFFYEIIFITYLLISLEKWAWIILLSPMVIHCQSQRGLQVHLYDLLIVICCWLIYKLLCIYFLIKLCSNLHTCTHTYACIHTYVYRFIHTYVYTSIHIKRDLATFISESRHNFGKLRSMCSVNLVAIYFD